MNATIPGPDGRPRCRWCAAAPEFFDYHDREWGFPVSDDVKLFEKISLEAFQSGLSWRTILAKREAFRDAFDGFDFQRIARYTHHDIERLLADARIVRHRGKIEAVVGNARCAARMAARDGGLAAFFWRFEPVAAQAHQSQSVTTIPEAAALSNALKKLGWRFVGPTTVYAFMQAMGLVNDHARDCVFREVSENARRLFQRPA